MIFRSRIIDCFKYLNKEKLERSYFTYQKTVKMGHLGGLGKNRLQAELIT